MVTETVETPTEPVVTDPEPQAEPQTVTPDPVVEPAAAEPEAAAVPQVEVVEEKPDYMTRADWEREKAEVAQRAAQDALEADRRRRQTEGARRAQQEKRDAELKAETADVVRATLSSKLGVDPSLITDDAIDTAISRAARRQAESLTAGSLDSVEQAWDYLTAPAYGKQVDLDPEFEAAASRLGPKLQHLVNTIRPQIEAEARKGYVHESEIPKIREAAVAAFNADLRDKGPDDVKRPDGTPASTVMSWSTYMNLPEEQRAAMPEAERREIIAADRKARLG